MKMTAKTQLIELIEGLSRNTPNQNQISQDLDRSIKDIYSFENNLSTHSPSEILSDQHCEQLLNYTHDSEGIKSPQELLAFRLVHDLFETTDITRLPTLLKYLVFQIRLPMLRLGLFDIKLLMESNTPPLLLLAEIIKYGNCWKDENNIGYPTFTKLSQLLYFSSTPTELLSEQFSNAIKPLSQIRENQLKRSKIFEKRLLEAELGKIKMQRAQIIANTLVSNLIIASPDNDFVEKILENHWSQLLILNYVREDNLSFHQSVKTMLSLVNSMAAPTSNSQLTEIIDSLPELNQALQEGLTKIAVEEVQITGFLAELEVFHIELIGKSQSLLIDDKETTTNTEVIQEEIIRLKPSSVFNNNDHINDSNNNNLIDQNNQCEAITNIKPISLSTLFNVDLKKPFDEEITIEEYTNIILSASNDKTILSKQKKSPLDAKRIVAEYAFVTDNWFYFCDESSSSKLLHISLENDCFLFVDKNCKISHRLNSHEINTLLEDKRIELPSNGDEINHLLQTISNDKNLINNLKKTVKSYASSKTTHKNNTKYSNQNKNIIIEQITKVVASQKNNSKTTKMPAEKQNQPNQKNAKLKSTIENTETNLAPSLKALEPHQLPVGSWLKISIDNKPIKCKLAAVIKAKNCFIFVDRQGKKLIEQTAEKLIEKHREGELELVDVGNTNHQFLESVISKTRNLKK